MEKISIEKDILFREGDYSIQRHKGIPEEAFVFLDSIAWGNDGAVYEHKNTEEHTRLLHNPMLIGIYEGDQIRGTAVFCNTPVTVDGDPFNCNYIRYFASSKAIRGKGVMKHFSRKVMELIREDEKEKTVYFACIERGNKGSYRVVESAGYTHVGSVNTIGFSRFFPKKSNDISQVNNKDGRKEVLDLLKMQYQHHALVQFNSIFLDDQYFVIRINDEIVAGCQYHRVHWVVNRMKGFTGKITMNVVPLVPVLNKLFNPKRFEFLAFEGIYVKPGHEQSLFELFEGLLAKEKLKSSMFWMGETCGVRKRIVEKGELGLIHSFVKDSNVFILASFQNMNEKEIASVSAQPMFVSGFDYI